MTSTLWRLTPRRHRTREGFSRRRPADRRIGRSAGVSGGGVLPHTGDTGGENACLATAGRASDRPCTGASAPPAACRARRSRRRAPSDTSCSSAVSSSTAAASRSSSSSVGSEMPASDTSRSMRRRASSISSSGRPTRTASPREAVCGSSPARIVDSRSTNEARSPSLPRLSSSACRISARPCTSRRSNERYSRSARHSSRRARRSCRLDRVDSLDEAGLADPVDAAVGGMILLVSHAAHPTAAGRPSPAGLSRRRAARCRG